MCEVGQPWFRQAVEARAGEEGERVVLLATGAMNPVHKAHINMFTVAKQKLEGYAMQRLRAAFASTCVHVYVRVAAVTHHGLTCVGWKPLRVHLTCSSQHREGSGCWCVQPIP